MTLTQAPDTFASVNADLIWMVYDANAVDTDLTDYKYVAEVYINGSVDPVHVERVYPRPDTGQGLFNFSALVRSYIRPKYDLNDAVIGAKIINIPDFYATVIVKIREEYDGEVGEVVLTDTARVFFNHYDGKAGSAVSWLVEYLNKPATARHRTIRMPFGCPRFFVPVFRSTSDGFDVVVTAQDAATITAGYTPYSNDLYIINIAPAAINAFTAGHIAPTDTHYTVNIDGEVFNVELICKGLYHNYCLHFIGQSGGWETALFNKARKRSKEIERKEYRQPAYRTSESGCSFATGNVQHAQRSVYAKTWTEKMRLTTDWLTDQDHEWLETLLQSPLVYMDDGVNIVPVVITNSNYDIKEWINDRITPVAVDVEFTGQYNAQYQ
jgi:hypothetical protein